MAVAALKAPVTERVVEEIPPIVTVYLTTQGGLHHSRCGRQVGYQGSRGRQEHDFYCLTCREHITLPQIVLTRLPIVDGVVGAS